MNAIIVKIIIMILIIVALMFSFFLYLKNTINSIKAEKRITRYSLSSKEDHELSLFERLNNFGTKFIHNFGLKLIKLKILKKYSHKYDKYLNSKNKTTTADYLAIKFFIGLLLLFLTFIMTIGYFDFKIFICYIISFLIGFYLLDIILISNYQEEKAKLKEELLNIIVSYNNAFASGYTVFQATHLITKEYQGLVKTEFLKVEKDLTYGLSISEAFNRLYERVELQEVKYISTSIEILSKNGGDVSQIFKLLEKDFLNEKNLNEEIRIITSPLKVIYKISLFIPLIVFICIYLINKNYFNKLISNPISFSIFTSIILIYILYILIMKKALKGNVK